MTLELIGPINTGAASGGAGVATANATTTTIVRGKIVKAFVKYNDSPPAGTTDLVIATAGITAPAETLLTLTNTATDVAVPLVQQAKGADGAAVTGVYDAPAVGDKIKVTISQANDGDNADVYLLVAGC